MKMYLYINIFSTPQIQLADIVLGIIDILLYYSPVSYEYLQP